MVERHEALRLRFDAGDGLPVQYPAPASAAGYGFERRTAEGDTALANALRDTARRPFDLIGGPVFRVGVFDTGPDTRVLQFVVHHIVADAWSMEVLFRDLLALYQGAVLPPLPVQFADIAQWQREWLAADHLDRRSITGA